MTVPVSILNGFAIESTKLNLFPTLPIPNYDEKNPFEWNSYYSSYYFEWVMSFGEHDFGWNNKNLNVWTLRGVHVSNAGGLPFNFFVRISVEYCSP